MTKIDFDALPRGLGATVFDDLPDDMRAKLYDLKDPLGRFCRQAAPDGKLECTRTQGHSGHHVAHSTMRGVVGIWEDGDTLADLIVESDSPTTDDVEAMQQAIMAAMAGMTRLGYVRLKAGGKALLVIYDGGEEARAIYPLFVMVNSDLLDLLDIPGRDHDQQRVGMPVAPDRGLVC